MKQKKIKSHENFPRTEKEKQKIVNKAAKAYAKFMEALGIDYENDPNSRDTPKRVAKAYVYDLIKGCFNEPPKITAFDNLEGYDGLVFQGNIELKSICSHHHLTFSGKAHVAYIPTKNGKVIGLSKLNRIVDFYARRPQVQENLTTQIHEHIDKVCEGNLGVAVVIEATHTCCSNRGIGHDSTMMTSKLSGAFMEEVAAREEFYNFIKNLKK
jgi:GTP cyclohydrolase I